MARPDSEDRQTIRLLGRLLGDVIRDSHGQAAFQLIEDIRQQVVGEHRSGGADAPMDRLTGLALQDILRLIRGFSIFSQLANIADDHVLRQETRALGSAAASLCAWWALGFVMRAFEQNRFVRMFRQSQKEDADAQ